ncbi:peptide deformylase [Bosea thiooxidans]|nr:peptide deformylase [Bosea sp. (in: a-proteobacteria)]
MAIRPLVILPDSQLRLVSKPVEAVTPEIRTLVDDMLATMYDAPGIGLAAIQVGVPLRLVTIDLSKPEAKEGEEPEPRRPQVFINPEVTWSSEELSVYEEGCLSIPEYYEEVERPAEVKVRYMGLDGKTQEIAADGLLATCLQHEIDHLNGVLFIDHLSRLKRERVTKKFAKAAKRERAA